MARVLVVEDEPAISLVLQEVLADEGHETEAVADGWAALDRLQAGAAPDLILMDLFLPGLSGRELLEELARRGLASVPVVIMTGALPIHGAFPPEGTYRAVIRKPFGVDEAMAVVAACLADSGDRPEVPE